MMSILRSKPFLNQSDEDFCTNGENSKTKAVQTRHRCQEDITAVGSKLFPMLNKFYRWETPIVWVISKHGLSGFESKFTSSPLSKLNSALKGLLEVAKERLIVSE